MPVVLTADALDFWSLLVFGGHVAQIESHLGRNDAGWSESEPRLKWACIIVSQLKYARRCVCVCVWNDSNDSNLIAGDSVDAVLLGARLVTPTKLNAVSRFGILPPWI